MAGGGVFEVDALLAVRKGKKGKEYLVSWKGFGKEEDSWEPESNLYNCKEELAKFKARSKSVSPSPSPKKSKAASTKSPGRKTSAHKSHSRSPSKIQTRSRSRSRGRKIDTPVKKNSTTSTTSTTTTRSQKEKAGGDSSSYAKSERRSLRSRTTIASTTATSSSSNTTDSSSNNASPAKSSRIQPHLLPVPKPVVPKSLKKLQPKPVRSPLGSITLWNILLVLLLTAICVAVLYCYNGGEMFLTNVKPPENRTF